MFHRHDFGNWQEEQRQSIWEGQTGNLIDHVTYNIRKCNSCGIVQEIKASEVKGY